MTTTKKTLKQRFWMWVWNHEWIPLGSLAPHVLAWALGTKNYGRVEK